MPKKEVIQMKEKRIEIDEIEAKRRLGSQLTKYLGSRDKVKVFARECKAVGLNLGSLETIKLIAQKPEYLVTILNYSQLGLLPKIGEAITQLKDTPSQHV